MYTCLDQALEHPRGLAVLNTMINLVQKLLLLSLCLVFFFPLFVGSASSQEPGSKPKLDLAAKIAREYSLGILDEIEKILTEYYYDPKYLGLDLTPASDILALMPVPAPPPMIG